MKLNKRQKIALSFVVGLIMFVTTALAEINSKSGYEEGKDILKYTATSLSDGTISNYTIERAIELKDNGAKILCENSITKYDVINKAIEKAILGGEGKGRYQNHSYIDSNIKIDSIDNGYRVSNNFYGNNFYKFSTPFERGDYSDLEKITDAAIGELKDYIVVSENPNGSKELAVSVNQAQIPTVVNAMTSYYFKSKLGKTYDAETQSNKYNLHKDIFIKSASGCMNITEQDIVDKIIVSLSVVGKDEQNNEHIITLDILLKITNINETTVKKPNLDDPNITVQYDNYQKGVEKVDINIYVGTYKSDITVVKNGEVIKIGDRTVEIKSLDTDTISIIYYQNYKDGYEEGNAKSSVFRFTGEQNNSKESFGKFYSLNYNIRDVDSNNSVGTIDLQSPSSIYFDIKSTNDNKDENKEKTNHVLFQRVVQ